MKLMVSTYLNVNDMRGSSNFRRGGGGGGGPGQSDKKALTTFCFVFFSPQLIYRSQMVNFKEIYHFSKLQRGSNIFQGVQLFPGGSNSLFPIETYIQLYNVTCDFPGGSGPPVLPPPPVDPHLNESLVNQIP